MPDALREARAMRGAQTMQGASAYGIEPWRPGTRVATGEALNLLKISIVLCCSFMWVGSGRLGDLLLNAVPARASGIVDLLILSSP